MDSENDIRHDHHDHDHKHDNENLSYFQMPYMPGCPMMKCPMMENKTHQHSNNMCGCPMANHDMDMCKYNTDNYNWDDSDSDDFRQYHHHHNNYYYDHDYDHYYDHDYDHDYDEDYFDYYPYPHYQMYYHHKRPWWMYY